MFGTQMVTKISFVPQGKRKIASVFLSSTSPLSSSSSSSSLSSSSSSPIVELREYALHPEHAASFMQETAQAADLRKSLVPLRLFSLPETGGKLNVATHAYYYGGGHDERNAKRAAMLTNADWKAYVGRTRSFAATQHSNIFLEAHALMNDNPDITGLAQVPSLPSDGEQSQQNCILELRRYKLRLGYDTVPKFLKLFSEGLPSKLTAHGTDPTTSLVTILYSDVGRLNEVIEIWRHGNGTAAMERSRAAARHAHEWRQAIAGIAELAVDFQTTIHKPAFFSPIRS